MSQAAAELNKAAGMEDDDVYAKIKAETAIESFQLSLNRSFAELELALMEEQQTSAGVSSPSGVVAQSLGQPVQALSHSPSTALPLASTTKVAAVGRVRPLARS